jgi:hypothetical protein
MLMILTLEHLVRCQMMMLDGMRCCAMHHDEPDQTRPGLVPAWGRFGSLAHYSISSSRLAVGF